MDADIVIIDASNVFFPKRYLVHSFFKRVLSAEYSPVDGYPADEVVIDYETKQPAVKTPLPTYEQLAGKMAVGEALWYFHDDGFNYRGHRLADEKAFNDLIARFLLDPNSYNKLSFWAR